MKKIAVVILLVAFSSPYCFSQIDTPKLAIGNDDNTEREKEKRQAVEKYREQDSLIEGIGWSRALPVYSQIAMPFLSYFSTNDNVNLSIGIVAAFLALQSVGTTYNLTKIDSLENKDLNITIGVISSLSLAGFAIYNFTVSPRKTGDARRWANYGLYQLSMIPIELSLFTVKFR